MGNKASTGKKNDGHPHAQAFQRIYGGSTLHVGTTDDDNAEPAVKTRSSKRSRGAGPAKQQKGRGLARSTAAAAALAKTGRSRISKQILRSASVKARAPKNAGSAPRARGQLTRSTSVQTPKAKGSASVMTAFPTTKRVASGFNLGIPVNNTRNGVMVSADVAEALAAGQPIDIANFPLCSGRADSVSPAIMCLPGDVPNTASRSSSPALQLTVVSQQLHANEAGYTATRSAPGSSGLRPTLDIRMTPTHMLASNVEFTLTDGRATPTPVTPADRPPSVLGGFVDVVDETRKTEGKREAEARPDFNTGAAGERNDGSNAPRPPTPRRRPESRLSGFASSSSLKSMSSADPVGALVRQESCNSCNGFGLNASGFGILNETTSIDTFEGVMNTSGFGTEFDSHPGSPILKAAPLPDVERPSITGLEPMPVMSMMPTLVAAASTPAAKGLSTECAVAALGEMAQLPVHQSVGRVTHVAATTAVTAATPANKPAPGFDDVFSPQLKNALNPKAQANFHRRLSSPEMMSPRLCNPRVAMSPMSPMSPIKAVGRRAAPSHEGGTENEGNSNSSNELDRRAKAAEDWTNKEVRKLIGAIKRIGSVNAGTNTYEVTFGALFTETENVFEALSGTCRTAKRCGVVQYNAEHLWQGQNDSTVLTLLKTTHEGIKMKRHRPSFKQKEVVRRGSGFGGTSMANTCQKCAKCSKTVYALEYVGASDKAYHKACFRCQTCNGVLKGNDYCVGGDGQFRCGPHHRDYETSALNNRCSSHVGAPIATRIPTTATAIAL